MIISGHGSEVRPGADLPAVQVRVGAADLPAQAVPELQEPWLAGAEVSASDHGNFSTYTNYGCRCELCRAANTKIQRDWHARNREHRVAYMREYRDKAKGKAQ